MFLERGVFINNYKKSIAVVSLFSGCGGMDLGFVGGFKFLGDFYATRNFNIVFSNDISKYACDVYEHNLLHKPFLGDIKNIDGDQLPKADVVIGGFPCQDFSHAGNRLGLSSDRGNLYLEMKRVIERINPKVFVAENVDGLRTSKDDTNISALDKIVNDFESVGYNVSYKVLNAADFGVPQTRIRVIIIGVRKDIPRNISFPKQTHGNGFGLKKYVTSKQAIDDLWHELDGGRFYNHSTKDFSKAVFYPSKRMQGNYQIKPDKPSCTIRAEHHGNIEGHYRSTNENDPQDVMFWRRLSVRECARLQSFPDEFNFICSTSNAYKLVGNAVPPVLAWHIAGVVYDIVSQK